MGNLIPLYGCILNNQVLSPDDTLPEELLVDAQRSEVKDGQSDLSASNTRPVSTTVTTTDIYRPPFEIHSTEIAPLYPDLPSLNSLCLDGPPVLEDPNTPMKRVASPQEVIILDSVQSRIASPVPSLVINEEKTPSLIAEESIAQLQHQLLSPATNPPVETVHNSSAKEIHREQCLINQQQQTVNVNIQDAKIDIQDTNTKNKHIFPVKEIEVSDSCVTTLGPMSLTDLLSIFYNPQLAYNEHFVDIFIEVRFIF